MPDKNTVETITKPARQNDEDLVGSHAWLRVLDSFVEKLIGISDETELAWYVARQVVGSLGFDDCVVYYFDSERNLIRQIAAIGAKNLLNDEIVNPLEIPIGVGVTGRVAETRQAVVVNNMNNHDEYIPDLENALSEICVPLASADQLFGVIDSEHPDANQFNDDHLKLLSVVASMTAAKLELIHKNKALQENLAWLENAQRIGQVGHWVWDAVENRELFQSQATIDIMGYWDIPHMPSWDEFLEIVHPEDREHVERIQAKSDQDGTSYECEYRIVHPNGETRFIIERGEPLFDNAGRLIKTVGTVLDVTDKKKSEESLRVALADAEQASKAKSEFLAHVSHELRTPLNANTGFAQMMTHKTFGEHSHPKYLEYAHDVLGSGQHLLSVINDVLDLSKVEAGEATLDPTSFSLRLAVEECVNLIKAQGAGNPQRVRIETSNRVADLYADKRIFKQVLLNLLSNADKFTPVDGSIAVISELDNDSKILIKVTDTGIGIALENLSKVLEPFGQVRSNPQITHKGTGLGLSLSQKMMELHGGTLEIQSEINFGTTVTITFPFQAAEIK